MAGKFVLLVDDVTTSGCTLDAGEVLVRYFGAVGVRKYAFAKTVQY